MNSGNTEHVSRNSPCPCGSGKRYKNCCGALSTVNQGADAASYPIYPGWERLSKEECAVLWEMMQTALDAQKGGKLERAKSLYESVLECAPGTFDALHMLGVIEMEFGNLDRSEELVTRAMKWFSTADMQKNLRLLRDRRRDRQGVYSLRSVAAADAIALFASQTPSLATTGRLDSCLLRPEEMLGATLHVVVPGDVLNPGSNRTGLRLFDRCVNAGLSVSLWRNPRQGVPTVALNGARDIDAAADCVPEKGLLAIAGLDTPTVEWLPQCANSFDEIYLLMDVHAPQSLAALLGRLPIQTLCCLRLVARSESVLTHFGFSGIVDPFLLGGPPVIGHSTARSGRPRLGVFILPLGGNKDRERWEMLTWLRAQRIFIRILYPGRLPSPHIPDEEEHLSSLVTDWHDNWSSDLDALFYWGAEGRAHQYDSLVIEAEAAGSPVIRDGYAETAVPGAPGEFFFTVDEARRAMERLISLLSMKS